MKKLFRYFIFILLLVFLIPIIFSKNFKEETVGDSINVINNNRSEIDKDYNYEKYNTVRLLHLNTNIIEEKNLDDYICEVVAAEMPASFEEEALKAQAVVARTYTIYKIINNENKHQNADICDDSGCCQAWISKEDRLNKWDDENKELLWKKIEEAVYSTKGKIVTYDGKPINAFFHANSGGKTEIPYNVWGGLDYPYLQTVETIGEDSYDQYNSEVKISKEEFISKIKEIYNNFDIDFSKEKSIEVIEYTDGDRVKIIKVGNKNFTGTDIRHIFGLKSANFKIDILDDDIKFTVYGYGHGVGMSQTGADSLAKEGKNYEEILNHFYTGVKISDI